MEFFLFKKFGFTKSNRHQYNFVFPYLDSFVPSFVNKIDSGDQSCRAKSWDRGDCNLYYCRALDPGEIVPHLSTSLLYCRRHLASRMLWRNSERNLYIVPYHRKLYHLKFIDLFAELLGELPIYLCKLKAHSTNRPGHYSLKCFLLNYRLLMKYMGFVLIFAEIEYISTN